MVFLEFTDAENSHNNKECRIHAIPSHIFYSTKWRILDSLCTACKRLSCWSKSNSSHHYLVTFPSIEHSLPPTKETDSVCVQVPNGIGFLLGIAQLILYGIFHRDRPLKKVKDNLEDGLQNDPLIPASDSVS